MTMSTLDRLRSAGLAMIVSAAALGLAGGAAAQASLTPDTRAAPSRGATGKLLLHVASDTGPATCRIYDAAGAPLTAEFGAPATVAVPRRAPGDQVHCIAADRNLRAPIEPSAQRVTITSQSGRVAGPPHRARTSADVHPDRGRIRLSAQAERDLVWLRERFDAGLLEERTYFERRREVINRDRDALQTAAAVSRASRRTR